MRLRSILPAVFALLPVCFGAVGVLAQQQTYRNIINMRFRTVSNGPQSALVVDVNDTKNADQVRKAVETQYAAQLRSLRPALQQELALLRQHRVLKPGQQIVVNDAVILRSQGRLALQGRGAGRTRANNDITFTIPTTGEGAWSQANATDIQNLINLIYPRMKALLGNPGWSGNVTVLNKDPRLGKVDEVIGALLVVNGTDIQIWFPTFNDFSTKFLGMAQVIAQAFHGPARIAYDAWEQGMARAAAVVIARGLQTDPTYAGTPVDPTNGFFFTPYYDLLNQPPLGNNTFTPPTKSNQDFNATTLSGMLVPRLEMSSTAWLKCYIENPNFFQTFNTEYYAAYAVDPTVANDVNRLRGFAGDADPQVEGQPFASWFEQQFVLDTSVTIGPKLYAYTLPTLPQNQTGDDSGAAVFLVYYQTTATGDETDLSATVNVVYWDYAFANRLFLPSFEQVVITNGFGTVAPFFVNIGGTPADTMRVAMDFPARKEYVRVYFPAGESGTNAVPTDFAGVVVGADAGALSASFEGNVTNTTVTQGSFGATAANIPAGFSRTTLTFTPTGGQPITFRRNTAFNNTQGVAPIFVLKVPNPTANLSHEFQVGPQMFSLPFKPLTSDLAKVLGINPNTTLIAQYRQDIAGADKYLRYPSLPLYQPGYALWANFSTGNFTATNLQGEQTDNQKDVTVALQFGWNQIGSPYTASINLSTDLQVQYLTDNTVVSLANAIQNGWIAAGIIGFAPDGTYVDVTNTTDPRFVSGTMEAWKGYWIRVLVTEGVTLTYVNPNNRSAARTGTARPQRSVVAAPAPGEWNVPLFVRDAQGHSATATFGQAARGSNSYVSSLDVASPPSFPGADRMALQFPHPEWNAGKNPPGSTFLSDMRRMGTRAEWDVLVTVPQPDQTYTLAWSNTATLPHGTRLTIVDKETGTRQIMNSVSGLAFHVNAGATTRAFHIIAEPRAQSHLFIRNVTAGVPLIGGRAASTVTISYELSADADTTVTILRAGRAVRHLNPGRAAASGVNQAVWDTRDDQGRSLPAGPYLLEIRARTTEGEQTRTITPLQIAR